MCRWHITDEFELKLCYEDTIFLVSTMSIINWIPFDLSTQIPFRNECSVELQYHMKERGIYKSYDL